MRWGVRLEKGGLKPLKDRNGREYQLAGELPVNNDLKENGI